MTSLVAIAIVLGGVVPAFEKERHVRFWMEVSDTVLTPGESVEVTWWCEFSPGVGQPVSYMGLPATVLFFQQKAASFVVEADVVSGVLSNNYINPALFDWAEQAGSIVGNTIWAVSIFNHHPTENPTPTQANPLWLFKFTWTPSVYKHDLATISMIKSSAKTSMALGVPSLGVYYPDYKLLYWPNNWPVEDVFVTIAEQACDADCDGSGNLTVDDFICFQTLYATGDPKADCDGDGQLLIDDFICFQTLYALGC